MLLQTLKPHDVVGMLLTNGEELIVTILGVSKHGPLVSKIKSVKINNGAVTMVDKLMSSSGSATLNMDTVCMYWKVDDRMELIYESC